MKKGIHPEYHKNAKVICACGNEIKTGSTVKEMHIEICSACHPFYTGKEKLIDSAGQVDRFKKRLDKAAQVKEAKKAQKKAKSEAKKKSSKKATEKKSKKAENSKK